MPCARNALCLQLKQASVRVAGALLTLCTCFVPRTCVQGGRQAKQPPVAAVVRTEAAAASPPLPSNNEQAPTSAHQLPQGPVKPCAPGPSREGSGFAFGAASSAYPQGQQHWQGGRGRGSSVMALARERMASHAGS